MQQTVSAMLRRGASSALPRHPLAGPLPIQSYGVTTTFPAAVELAIGWRPDPYTAGPPRISNLQVFQASSAKMLFRGCSPTSMKSVLWCTRLWR